LDGLTLADVKKRDLTTKLSEKRKTIIKNSSLYSIVQFAKKNHVALICEIKDSEFADTKFIMDLVKYLYDN
jgi:hypothetical protein